MSGSFTITLTNLKLKQNLFADKVRLTDGSWLPATPIPGSILVNTGDLLERWTSGYFPATVSNADSVMYLVSVN